MRFDQLEAYRTAIRYVGVTRPFVLRLRRDDEIMAKQMQRAVLSIPLNLAEGAGEFSPGEKVKFYRYAVRSTAETIALLDAARVMELITADDHRRCREIADRLMAMLTRLVVVVSERQKEGTSRGT